MGKLHEHMDKSHPDTQKPTLADVEAMVEVDQLAQQGTTTVTVMSHMGGNIHLTGSAQETAETLASLAAGDATQVNPGTLISAGQNVVTQHIPLVQMPASSGMHTSSQQNMIYSTHHNSIPSTQQMPPPHPTAYHPHEHMTMTELMPPEPPGGDSVTVAAMIPSEPDGSHRLVYFIQQ